MTLQTRRTTGLTPLAIVLPRPPLPRRSLSKSSLLSSNDPHTPRGRHSPSLSNLQGALYYSTSNRKSSDSWNSSNADADEMEYEWLSEQVLLLFRTLDALPAHLITPFHGPVPPSNLLDKIARHVSQAKGPIDWPHSIRATRVKLLELARARAKEEKEKAIERARHLVIREEGETEDDVDTAVDSYGDSPRPLYRQSSMDFIKPGPEDIKENVAIARLSKRLQRTDRLVGYHYHPYSRSNGTQPQITPATAAKPNLKHRRSSSPPRPNDVPSLISPSTPSSSTLNTLSSASASIPRGLRLRRSASTLSSISMSLRSSADLDAPLPDPRVQRVKRSETFCGPGPLMSAPAPPPKDLPAQHVNLKRAPSYGAVQQESKLKHDRKAVDATSTTVAQEPKQFQHERKLSSGSCVSSDEEEKVRSKRVKKIKTSPSRGVLRSCISDSSSASVMGDGTDTTPSPPADGRPSDIVLAPSLVAKAPKLPAETRGKNVVMKSGHAKTSIAGSTKEGKLNGMVKMGTLPTPSTTTLKLESKSPKVIRSTTRPLPMSLQRNPSMFGDELPPLPKVTSTLGGKGKSKGVEIPMKKSNSPPASGLALSSASESKAVKSKPISKPGTTSAATHTTIHPSSSTSSSASPTGARALRRVRRLDLGFGRKIEFDSLGGSVAAERNQNMKEGTEGLASAIQLV